MKIIFINNRNIIIHNKKDDIFIENFSSLSSSDILNIEKIKDFDAIIIDNQLQQQTNVIRILRQNLNEEIALKPAFLFYQEQEEVKEDFLNISLFDGKIAEKEIDKLITPIQNLTEKIVSLPIYTQENLKNFKEYVGYRVLKFLYTRGQQLIPVINLSSDNFYTYPIIDVFFSQLEKSSISNIFNIVEYMEKENFVTGKFVDIIHKCSKCSSSYLNFREVCPKCGSPNISKGNLIHHFICGFTSPESNFIQKEGLMCPKCNRVLKHIGIDYDKPSNIFICNSCGINFQEPNTDVFCFKCQSKFSIEQIQKKEVKSYELTPKAIEYITYLTPEVNLSLSQSNISQINEYSNIVPYNFFEHILFLELERKKRYNKEGTICFFQILNNFLPIKQSTKKDYEMQQQQDIDLSKKIKNLLRKSDIMTFINPYTMLILFTETPIEKAKIAIEHINSEIEKPFYKKNFFGLHKNPLNITTVYFSTNNIEQIRGFIKNKIANK
jgi:Zn finger protein HypA/HybF involved in hydrogenase expression